MRVLISAEGQHTANHPFTHRMVVDLRSTLIDFTGMQNSAVDPSSLTDPTVRTVTWGPVIINAEHREAGVITKVDGSRQTFFDKNVLTPYLDAFEQRMFDLAHQQAQAENAALEQVRAWQRATTEARKAETEQQPQPIAQQSDESRNNSEDRATIVEQAPPEPEPVVEPAPAEPHPADPVHDAKHGIRRPSEGVRVFDPDGTGGKQFG